ncbi:MAG: cobalamin-dependent protein [Dehalococcoidales bacterium]
MAKTDLILLHAPHVYDFRKIPQLYGPVSDLVLSTPAFEMYPIGFSSLAEYLGKAGYHVRVVNLAGRMLRNARFDAEEFIRKLHAPVFGIDLHWMVHAHGAIEVARLVKKHHPDSKVIFGGFSASYFYKELIVYPEVDYVMRGDSTEEPMRLFMQAVKEGKLESIPNLVWKDAGGKARDNGLTFVPDNISDVMQNHYSAVVRSVLRYRDLASTIPVKEWLNYPVTAGLMPWVFKRPWPVVAIQLMDGFGHPTAPYYFLKRTYEPTHVLLRLPWLLQTLGRENVTSLLVEGGGETNALWAPLCQRVVFFYAPLILGGRQAPTAIAGDGARTAGGQIRLREAQWRRVGGDLLLTARVQEPE